MRAAATMLWLVWARRIALELKREAESAQAALVSALGDIKGAIPSATPIEAAPDFVGSTDVADVIGVARQNMRKLMVSHESDAGGQAKKKASAISRQGPGFIGSPD